MSANLTPVVVISAQADVAVRVFVLNAGADDFLTKPFQFEELMTRVRAVFRRHRAELTSKS